MPKSPNAKQNEKLRQPKLERAHKWGTRKTGFLFWLCHPLPLWQMGGGQVACLYLISKNGGSIRWLQRALPVLTHYDFIFRMPVQWHNFRFLSIRLFVFFLIKKNCSHFIHDPLQREGGNVQREVCRGNHYFKMHGLFPCVRGIHILLEFLGTFLSGSGSFPWSTS